MMGFMGAVVCGGFCLCSVRRWYTYKPPYQLSLRRLVLLVVRLLVVLLLWR